MSAARSAGLLWAVLLVGGLGLAVIAFPLDVVASALLVIVMLALCAAVAVGAKSATGSLMKWAVALVLVASVWPVVSARVRQGLAAAFQGGSRPGLGGGRPVSGLDDLLYDLTTLALVVGLMLLAAGVLLLSARIGASLRPPTAPPRPQARRRGRLVDPRADAQLPAPAADHQAADDFGLLGDRDGR